MVKYLYFFTFLALAFCDYNPRFKDQEQLEKHHSHVSDSNAKIVVHLIPHSHDDVGWLKTVDQYFYGLKQSIQFAAVEYTIDTYIQELQKDPSRRFIQVETAFFKMWWDLQNDNTKQITKTLVKNGQLEFVSGGWCMNDEATPYYEDIIDQMTLGHKFILDNFNVTPSAGWQIDPFGHQNTQATFSYQMGFDSWFFSRIDYQDKEARLEARNMETIMVPPTAGVQYPIFTHVQYYHYEAPPGFNFDARREHDAIDDNLNSYGYNVVSKSEALVNYFKAQANHYKGNVLLHTFGSDFEWTNSHVWYKNLDKLIKYINSNPQYNMELKYSTPSAYVKEVNQQGLNYSTKTDDFFPYSDGQHEFWTGYFTSRVAIKGYVKRFGRQAQIYRRLISYFTLSNNTWVAQNEKEIDGAIQDMDEALGICQHHDAVSGTEKQHVNDDYLRILAKAENRITAVVQKLLSAVLYGQADATQYEICNWNMSASQCSGTYQALMTNKTVLVTLVDGKVGQSGENDLVRLKVPNLKYLIKDWKGQVVAGDVDCSNNYNDCDLYFVYQIPADNILVYFTVQPVQSGESASEISIKVNPFAYNDDTPITFLNSTKNFTLKYGYYESYQGPGQKSGAYIFRSVNSSDVKKQYGTVIYTALGYGKVMSVFRVSRSYTKTVIRKFNTFSDTFEIQTFLDSIPTSDNQGKEIVMIIDTGINNGKTFYTDSNGLELQKRVVNYRPTWNLTVFEQAAGNYYPVNGVIMIKDANNNAAALLNDRSQGGASLKSGQIEIMIQRKTLYDDDRGVGEPLLEQDIFGVGITQYVLHRLTFFNAQTNQNWHRKLQYYMDLAPIALLSDSSKTPNVPAGLNWLSVFPGLNITNSIAEKPLLKVYVQRWNKGEYLMRLQNFQEYGNMTVDNTQLSMKMDRTTLTGNQLWADWDKKRLVWKFASVGAEEPVPNDNFKLQPLQIQAFLVKSGKAVFE